MHRAEELLTQEELLGRSDTIGSERDMLNKGRLFPAEGPGGVGYNPAFFADESLDFQALSRVIRVLSKLPASSKYNLFFVSKSFTLRVTSLEVLAAGHRKDVLITADEFAGR